MLRNTMYVVIGNLCARDIRCRPTKRFLLAQKQVQHFMNYRQARDAKCKTYQEVYGCNALYAYLSSEKTDV